jgi:RNA polymerase sigma-54 factor
LTEKQLEVARYIIGSIDNDGILDKDLQSISDDLAFYHNLDATVDEIEQVLLVIQDFDPAGIGARNLQECLLIQIRRKPDSPLKELQETIIANMFDEFTRKRQDKIAEKLRLDQKTMDEVMAELLKLNPRPGSALGETIGSSRQHIVPDFIVDCYNDDEISFTLNSSNIPTLRVNREYSDMLDNQIKSGKSNQRDAAIYLKRKLDAARGFIQALKQREQTLTSTMRAIIEKQRTFFLEGDESQLKPMVLKDIAEMTGYDISTISRSTSGKYVQTCFGTFPLKFFFTDGVRKKSGEKVSVKKIHSIIRDLIANEDQASPLTDEELASMLLERGFKIARRTVAKYREQIGIPVARLRKR